MVQVSYPGVYVVEVPSGVHTITGVSTSIAAFFGRASKGPINKAVRCLSMSDYVRAFGGPHPLSDLADSVEHFFANGGTDCYVVRLASSTADEADVTLTNLAGVNVLVATAKTEGLWGNGVRMEVDYNTPNPDATFRLTVIHEDGGVEVARETHTSLSMDPASPRFAPDFVSNSSALIELALHVDVALGGTTDLSVLANSFPGFSQSRVFATTPIGGFRALFEGLLTASPRFIINVDGAQDVAVDLTSVLGPAAPAIVPGSPWSLLQMENRIDQVINDQLNAVSAALSVTVDWQTVANFSALHIISNTADRKSVTIRRSSSLDFAVPTNLGLDQGGIEPARYSNFRPVPTSAFFHDVDDIVEMGGLERDDITSIAIDGGAAIPFSFTTMTPIATDPWFLDSSGNSDGIRAKLAEIVRVVNAAAGPFRAELWGYHIAFIAKEGSINRTAASVVSAGDTLLGGANFTRNVRRYTLGNTGTGAFQQLVPPGAVGNDGGVPQPIDYIGDELAQTGFHALDSVDLFNLMVLPGDREVTEAMYLQIIGPASAYCQSERAFLLVDAPDSWTSASGRPVATATEVNSLRALVTKDHSAVFYPKALCVCGPARKPTYMSPSGIIAGLMSRIDSNPGVWKAPAGVDADLHEVLDLNVNLTDRENGVLNKLGVNCLRKFPSGIVNWGARTLDGSDDIGSEWKYIPIRRLALFLEESLYRGTKWVVFQPNDEPLWAQIRMNLNAFMMGLFRQGAFQGSTPDKAFFVKCDGETTTQADRNLGIVNIIVGFAPLKPAEFVIIKIQQIAGELV